MKRKLLCIIATLFLYSISYSQSKVIENNLVQYGDKWFKENDDQPFSGIVFDMDKETGKKVLEYVMSDGLKNGKYTRWSQDGNIIVKGFYKSDVMNREWTFYYKNGQKKERITYKDGKVNGLGTVWYENGQKKEEGTIKDGEVNGLYTFWYENGQKKEEGTIKDGEKNGLYTFWYENGQRREEGTYNDGKKDGLWIEKDIMVVKDVLLHFSKNDSEWLNYVMLKVKELANSDPALQGVKNLKALMKAAYKAKFASKKDVIRTVKKLAMSGQMESYILKTSGSKTGEQFFESMGRKAKPPLVKMYNEIKNSNTVAKELAMNQYITLDDLLVNKKLVYNPPIKDYAITSFSKLKEDVISLSKNTKDEKYKKILKRSLVEISQLERNFHIVQNLNEHGLTDQQRPLFFFRNETSILVKGDMKYFYEDGIIIKGSLIK